MGRASDIRKTQFEVDREITNPVARGLNNFYVPQAKPVVSQSQRDLIDSLAYVVPALNRYQEKKEEILTAEETAKGIEAFQKNKIGFKKAVADGLIPEGANPHFVIAYNQMELEDKGRKFSNIIKQKYAEQQGALLESTDPNVVNDFIKNELDIFMKDNNIDGYDSEDIVNHFLPKVDGVESEINNNVANGRIAVIQNKAEQSYASSIYELITEGFNIDADNIEELIGDKINGEILKYSDVKTTSSLNKIAVETIITHAKDNLDIETLDIIGNVKTQGGKTLADIPEYKDLINTAEQQIYAELKEIESFKRTYDDNKRKDKYREDTKNFSEFLTNPTKDGEAIKFIDLTPRDIEDYLVQNNITEPDTKTYIRSLYNNKLQFLNNIAEDVNVINDIDNLIFQDPFNPEIENLIAQAVENNDITSERAMGYSDTLETQKAGSRSTLLNNDLLTQLESNGVRTIQKGDFASNSEVALVSNRFTSSFTTDVRTIASEVEADTSITPANKQFEFEKRVRARYEELLRIYTIPDVPSSDEAIEEATMEADDPDKFKIKTDFDNKTEQKDNLISDIKGLEANLVTVQEENQAKIDKYTKKKQKAQNKLATNQERLANAKSEAMKKTYQGRIDDANEDIADYNEIINEAQSKIDNLQNNINKKLEQVTALNTEINKLKEQLK